MNAVCFAAYEGFEGCTQSCRNAAGVLGGTSAVVSPNGEIPKAALEADILILSSWHRTYEPLLARRGPHVLLRWHSTILQTEIGHEGSKLAHVIELLERGRVAGLWVNDPELWSLLGRRSVTFVPDVLSLAEYADVTPAPLRGVHISLFGAVHARKNVLAQSAAFERARRAAGAPPWTLHLNGHSLEDPVYERWLADARIPYVDHGWMTRDAYLSLVSAMDVGLCATLCESYCYVAADHVALGVPIVPSPAIACLGDDVIRRRPDRVEDIADGLATALASRAPLASAQRLSLARQAEINATMARAALSSLDERAHSQG